MDFSPNWAVPETAPPGSFVPLDGVRHRAFAWRKLRWRSSTRGNTENCGYSLHSFKQNAQYIFGIFLPSRPGGAIRYAGHARVRRAEDAEGPARTEWREPPGRLGEYVRRGEIAVRRQALRGKLRQHP